MKEYRTIKKEAEITLIEKKSKFIAKIKPVKTVEAAEEFIAAIQKENWNATHNVPAYILGLNSEIQKYSDDNEPSGTAGLPMLEVFKANEVVDLVCVVTRYFGGTLLGRGGLIRAYGGAAREALLAAGIVRMIPCKEVQITVDYVHSGKVQNELLQRELNIKDIVYLEKVTFHCLVLPEELESVSNLIQEVTANEFEWQLGKDLYLEVPLANP